MAYYLFRYTFLFMVIFFSSWCHAKPLQVGVISSKPIAYQDDSGQWQGVIIDIWAQIARQNKWEYELFGLGDDVHQAITMVHDKKIDLLIGPVSVSNLHLKLVEFSQPYFLNTIGLVEHQSNYGIFSKIYQLFFGLFASIVGAILLICLFFSVVLWITEKKFGQTDITKATWTRGVAYMYWTSLITVLSNGPVFHPKSFASRFVLLILVIISSCFGSLIISSMTSVLTLSVVQDQEMPTFGFRSRSIGTLAGVKGRYGAGLSDMLGYKTVQTANLDEALDLLEQDKVSGVIGNTILLKIKLQEPRYSNLKLSAHTFGVTKFAIAVPMQSPLRYPINDSLVALQYNNRVYNICKNYMSQSDALACAI